MGERRDVLHGGVRKNRSKTVGCREQDRAVSFVGKADSSSHSGSSRTVHGLFPYSERNGSVAVSEVTGLSMWKKDLTTNGNESVCTDSRELVIALCGGVGMKQKAASLWDH